MMILLSRNLLMSIMRQSTEDGIQDVYGTSASFVKHHYIGSKGLEAAADFRATDNNSSQHKINARHMKVGAPNPPNPHTPRNPQPPDPRSIQHHTPTTSLHLSLFFQGISLKCGNF
ncbi:hypothetical protein J6590_042868 [Homalodisca vitripennis]|nr:hypothetical protein J6590_042868 [Homalodisca vitripennis]